jgi:glycosyltransferase involved in cell wall biosynthesis
MNDNPFFSIILPTFNQDNFLKRAVQSIISQEFKDWELLIIDNFSTDNTTRVINNFKDTRIKTIKIHNNGILAKSRNIGVKKSKADWICFLDSDDIWYSEKLKYNYQYIQRLEPDLLYHPLHFLNDKIIKKKIPDKIKSLKKPIIKDLFLNGNGIGQSSVVLKKKILEKINYISEDKDKYSWEDFDTWIKISSISDKFFQIPKTLGAIWVGPENISNLDRTISNYENIKKIYGKKIEKWTRLKLDQLWWINYPKILKQYKEKKFNNELSKKIRKIKHAPLRIKIRLLFINFNIWFIFFKNYKKIFNIIVLFRFHKKNNFNIEVNNFIKFNKLQSINSFKNYKFDNYKFDNDILINRFKNNDILYILYKSNNLISYGWSSEKKNFFISEINAPVLNHGAIILYDFKTIKNFRNKGYYKLLIKNITTLYKYNKKKIYIYTLLFNFKSLKSIYQSGFKYICFIFFKKKKILFN